MISNSATVNICILTDIYVFIQFSSHVDADQGVDPSRETTWDDEVAHITLRDIEVQRERLQDSIRSVAPSSPTSTSMWIMYEAVNDLLKICKAIGPLGSLWEVACQTRRARVMGPDKWPAVKEATRGHNVKGTLFDIPPDRGAGQPLRLKEFKLEGAAPYVYDRFIGAWGMFPHHH